MCINTNPGDIQEPGIDSKYDRLFYPADQYTTFKVSDTDVDEDIEVSDVDLILDNQTNNDSKTQHTHRHNKPGRAQVDVKAYGYCKRCRVPRPPRTHHCQICRKCVLAMDHHCPWMNNCVGYYNYRYFLLFLLFLFICVVYGAIFLYQPFKVLLNGDPNEINLWFPPDNTSDQLPITTTIKSASLKNGRKRRKIRGLQLASLLDVNTVFTDEKGAVFFCFFVAIVISIAVGILLFWHLYLVSTAQTTIEFYANHDRRRGMQEVGLVYKNPFDLGFRENWALVMGKGKNALETFRLFLPSSRPPPLLSKKVFENLRNMYVVPVQAEDLETGRLIN